MLARKLPWTGASLLMAALFVAPLAPLWAQEAPTAPAAAQERVIKVLQVSPQDTVQIAELLSVLGVEYRISEQLGLISVVGSPEAVSRLEAALKDIQSLRTTQPAGSHENVELTVHLLGIVDNESSPVPAGPLRDVIAELKKSLPMGGYRLLETFILRSRVGQDAGITGTIPSGQQDAPPTEYKFSCRIADVQNRESPPLISINSLSLGLRVPVKAFNDPSVYQMSDVVFRTALEVPDGKTAVIGKAGAPGDSHGFLVVLTAKVIP